MQYTEKDLTKKACVKSLMASSKSEQEWNDNCDKVKDANGGDYPDFWYWEVVMSGLMGLTANSWEV